jgi:hypothetical protein
MGTTWPSSAAVILDFAWFAPADNLSETVLTRPKTGCHRQIPPELVRSATGEVHPRA